MKKQKFNDYSFPAGRVRKAEELIEFTPPDSKEVLQDKWETDGTLVTCNSVNIALCCYTDKEVSKANAELIVKAVNNHNELFQMVKDLKNCIKRLAYDDVSQFDRDNLAQWEGEAHELLVRINPNYYQNANAKELNK
jgi:hypothetical protein